MMSDERSPAGGLVFCVCYNPPVETHARTTYTQHNLTPTQPRCRTPYEGLRDLVRSTGCVTHSKQAAYSLLFFNFLVSDSFAKACALFRKKGGVYPHRPKTQLAVRAKPRGGESYGYEALNEQAVSLAECLLLLFFALFLEDGGRGNRIVIVEPQ